MICGRASWLGRHTACWGAGRLGLLPAHGAHRRVCALRAQDVAEGTWGHGPGTQGRGSIPGTPLSTPTQLASPRAHSQASVWERPTPEESGGQLSPWPPTPDPSCFQRVQSGTPCGPALSAPRSHCYQAAPSALPGSRARRRGSCTGQLPSSQGVAFFLPPGPPIRCADSRQGDVPENPGTAQHCGQPTQDGGHAVRFEQPGTPGPVSDSPGEGWPPHLKAVSDLSMSVAPVPEDPGGVLVHG